MKIASSIAMVLALLMLAVGAIAQRPELFVATGHSGDVQDIEFSPDGKLLATKGDETVRLWDVATGQELRVLVNDISYSGEVSFSRDGRVLASQGASLLDTYALTDIATGKDIRPDQQRFGRYDDISSITFSANGKYLAYAKKNEVFVCDARGLTCKSFLGHTGSVDSVAFSPDSLRIASSSEDKSVRIWNIESGRQLKELRHPYFRFTRIVFGPKGDYFAATNFSILQTDSFVTFWNAESGQELMPLGGKRILGSAFSFSPDGQYISIGNFDKSISIYELGKGSVLKTLVGASQVVRAICFSPDGRRIAGAAGNVTLLWDISDGNLITEFGSNASSLIAAVLSPDAKRIAITRYSDSQTRLWDLSSSQQMTVVGHAIENYAVWPGVAFSHDGARLATVDSHKEDKIRIWETASGRQLKEIPTTGIDSGKLAFSNDGRRLAVRTDSYSIKIWNIDTGEVETTLRSGYWSEDVLTFSPDDTMIASYRRLGDEYKFWDIRKNQEISYSPANRPKWAPRVSSSISLTTGDQKKMTVWTDGAQLDFRDPETASIIAELTILNGTDWIVTTPSGLFDGTPSAFKQLVWRFDSNTFNYAPVEAFFKEFYRPGLLQEIMSGKTPEAPKTDLATIDIRQPDVKIVTIDGQSVEGGLLRAALKAPVSQREVEVAVEVTDNNTKGRRVEHLSSSGAQDLRLFRNGSLVGYWKGDVFSKASGCVLSASTANEPRKAICKTTVAVTAGNNELSVYAFNGQNVKSNDFTATVSGPETLKRKGKLHVLAVGVNKYANEANNLKFAVADAVDFATELRKKQIELNNYETPEVIQLTDAEATKKNILHALLRLAKGEKAGALDGTSDELARKFASIEKVQPEDVVVIYFAGHGTAAKDRFYLIPHDGFPMTSASENERVSYLYSHSISDIELEDALRDVNAGQMMMVVDACNSGQALEAEEKRRGPMNSKGLAQLAYEKGMLILTASQSYQAALEVTRTPQGKKIEHGLLTYSLLEGLSVPAADTDGDKTLIDREWLNYAVQQVPQMQLEAMRTRDTAPISSGEARGPKIFFVNGEDKNLPPEKRGLQTPRVFYRRETNLKPLIVAGRQ